MINETMTWEPAKARWRKMYRGRMYTVSCYRLASPPTKVGSYKAANDWWVAKRAEIDGPAPKRPHEWALRQLAERLAWAQGHGKAGTARSIREDMEILEDDRDGDLHPSIGHSLLGDQTSYAVWAERLVGHSRCLWP